MNTSIFKSIETCEVKNNKTGISINGPGIITNIHGDCGEVYIDGRFIDYYRNADSTDFNIYLFNESCRLCTTISGGNYYVKCALALFH